MVKKSNPKGSSISDFFDTTIPENVRNLIKWKDDVSTDKPQALSTPESDDENKTVKIPVVELFDDSGEKIVFELLDTLEYGGEKYSLLTPYYETEEEYNLTSAADVFIMKEVWSNTGESMLETVENVELLQKIYSIFKQKHSSDYEFRDN